MTIVCGGGAPGRSELRWKLGDNGCRGLVGLSFRTGLDGLDDIGDPGWELACLFVGWRVKRNRRPGICQNIFWDTNMLAHSWLVSSMDDPTAESSVAMRPILSSLGIRLRPLRTPSLLIFILQSPLGLPSAAVYFEFSFAGRVLEGAGWWKYQYRVIHRIIAIWRVGDAAGLKSAEEGFDMEEM